MPTTPTDHKFTVMPGMKPSSVISPNTAPAGAAACSTGLAPRARPGSTRLHLAVPGPRAMISTAPVAAGTPMESVVLRLGIVLVVLALAHGITVSALTRIRNRLEVENATMRRMQAHDEHRTH